MYGHKKCLRRYLVNRTCQPSEPSSCNSLWTADENKQSLSVGLPRVTQWTKVWLFVSTFEMRFFSARIIPRYLLLSDHDQKIYTPRPLVFHITGFCPNVLFELLSSFYRLSNCLSCLSRRVSLWAHRRTYHTILEPATRSKVQSRPNRWFVVVL